MRCVALHCRVTIAFSHTQHNTGYGNPRIMKIDLERGKKRNPTMQKYRQDIFDHHERSKRRVINSRLKQGRCDEMRRRLNKCLREHL